MKGKWIGFGGGERDWEEGEIWYEVGLKGEWVRWGRGGLGSRKNEEKKKQPPISMAREGWGFGGGFRMRNRKKKEEEEKGKTNIQGRD